MQQNSAPGRTARESWVTACTSTAPAPATGPSTSMPSMRRSRCTGAYGIGFRAATVAGVDAFTPVPAPVPAPAVGRGGAVVEVVVDGVAAGAVLPGAALPVASAPGTTSAAGDALAMAGLAAGTSATWAPAGGGGTRDSRSP